MDCCELHKNGKYKNWKCGFYNPEERRKIYLSKRILKGRSGVGHKKGEKLPQWWKDKITNKFQSGEKHWNWKGGSTNESKRIKSNKIYKEWRKEVFERDKYTCQDCGIIGGELHPHHIKPFAYYPELRFEITNGQTLCAKCHRKTDSYGVNKKI